MKGIGIVGVGHAVPEKILTNQDIVAMGIETSDQWIIDRTGIHERRIITEDQTISDLAVIAAKNALNDANLSPQDIDMIIVATSTAENANFPSTACVIQDRLGMKEIPAFDLSAACSGFSYALTTAEQFIIGKQAKRVLVVGADCLSTIVDWKDRGTCILFGDGAGAVVVSMVESAYGLLYSKLYSAGRYGDILTVKNEVIHMQGKQVFKVAIDSVVPAIAAALKSANLSPNDIAWFIPHQANKRIMTLVAEKIGISNDKLVSNLEYYGNTSAASIPLALSELDQAKKIKSGDILLLVGFGAGFTWGVTLLKWSKKEEI